MSRPGFRAALLPALLLGGGCAAALKTPPVHTNPVVLVEFHGSRPLTSEERRSGSGQPPWLREIRDAAASGFFVNEAGDIVTNHHAVVKAGLEDTRIKVTVDSKWVYRARVVRAEKGSDLAVLRIDLQEGTRVMTYPLSGASLDEGDAVFALGHPGGGPMTREGGRVTRLGPLFECTIPVRLGNSGGPVLSQRGAVVGVVTGLRTRTWKAPGAMVETEHCLVVPVATLRDRLDEWEIPYSRD